MIPAAESHDVALYCIYGVGSAGGAIGAYSVPDPSAAPFQPTKVWFVIARDPGFFANKIGSVAPGIVC